MESYLTAEISASAIGHNLSLLRSCLTGPTKLCAVVKADCYGHGLRALLGVVGKAADCLGVATPDEAILLRNLGYERPILMFFSSCAHADGPELREGLEELIARNVTLTIAAEDEAAVVEEVARRVGTTANIHVKVDSGMGRSGILAESLPAAVEHLRNGGPVRLTGLYTHFATADEADKQYARQQLARFLAAVEACGGREGLILHAANSAATIDLADTHLDMVRPGIAIYGYQPSDDMHRRLPLRPVLRLTGKLMQVKNTPAGSPCGYGLTHTFRRDSRVGLVPVGYADGYLRCFSNRTTVRIGGLDMPICGRVSMDQIVIDLTDAPAAKVGDVVEIISPDPAAPHSVENLARLAGTIPYEITCRLGRRVRRILVD